MTSALSLVLLVALCIVSVPVLVLPLLPWLKPRRRVPIPVKRKKLQQKRPTLQPQGLRPRQQLPNRQPLRLPQAERRCCPVRHEWLDNDGEGLFTEPPWKKGKKRTYGKLELKPPDFEIPEFGGGNRRPVIAPSISHPLVITPPAAGLLCMVLITGGTLDTTHPYKSTPGDDIFKCQKVITGVCFHPCYTGSSSSSNSTFIVGAFQTRVRIT